MRGRNLKMVVKLAFYGSDTTDVSRDLGIGQ